MQLLVDECLAESSVLVLNSLGFEISRVEDALQVQVSDEEILEYSRTNHVPIITHDRRFGFLYLFSTDEPWTTVIIQVQSPHPQATNALILKTFTQLDLDQDEYRGKLIIITPNNIRVRSQK